MFLAELSIAERFNFIKNGETGLLSVPQIKKILHDKIIEEMAHRTNNRTVFDKIKREIANVEDLDNLQDLIHELNESFEYQPSNELISADLSSLVRDEAFSESESDTSLSLNDIL